MLEQDRHNQRRPDGHPRGSAHDERLQQQSVHHDDRAVESEHVEKLLEAAGEQCDHCRPDERQHRPEVRNELEHAARIAQNGAHGTCR